MERSFSFFEKGHLLMLLLAIIKALQLILIFESEADDDGLIGSMT